MEVASRILFQGRCQERTPPSDKLLERNPAVPSRAGAPSFRRKEEESVHLHRGRFGENINQVEKTKTKTKEGRKRSSSKKKLKKKLFFFFFFFFFFSPKKKKKKKKKKS